MGDLESNDITIEDETAQSHDDCAKKKEKRGMSMQGDAMSPLKAGPSSRQTRLSAKRKLDKAKKKSQKKKRAKIEKSAEDDIDDCDETWDDEEVKSPKDLVLASVADALAEKIDENAKKSNLSTANVKSLLHHLLTDKLLVEFAQRVALDAANSEIQATNDLGIETRLTRSKWKKSKKQGEVECPKFFETDLEEDSEEDEEYDPNNERLILPSDDDSIHTPHSGLRSPSLPKTPESQNKDWESFEDHDREVRCEDASLFKIPGEPLSACKKSGFLESGEEELIAYRTRSRISMKDLSLDALTASLDPPDYDPALYDFTHLDESDPDDVEWKNWLNGLFQDNVDESFEENDEDFNFMASEEEVDHEEFRTDKGVKISQKEVQDLLGGILDEFGENIKDQSTILKYVVPKFAISDAQRLHITAQLQQHTQLLAQVYMLSYNDASLEKESSNTRALLSELASFRNAVDNDIELRNRSAYYFAGLQDAMRIIDSLDEITRLESKLIERDAMPVHREVQWEKRANRDMLVDISPRMALRMVSEPFFATFPELLPEQGSTASKKMQQLVGDRKRVKFFRSEDNLLALGLEQFGRNFDLISKYLMPVLTPLQLKTKAKNLLSKREYSDNPVRVLKLTNKLPPLDSGLCINTPRVNSNKAIKDMHRELSLRVRLPLWIDKFNDIISRLGWTVEELKEDLPVLSMEVHYGKAYRPICPNGPLPASIAKMRKPQLTAPLLNAKEANIIVEAKSPCVLKLTIPQRPELDSHRRRKSKSRKVCKVAKSVQTDTNDRALSPMSPSADGHLADGHLADGHLADGHLADGYESSPIKLTSLAVDVPEKNSSLSKGSPLSSPGRSPCVSTSSTHAQQAANRDYKSSQPLSIKYEAVSSLGIPQNVCQSRQLLSASTCGTHKNSPSSSVPPSAGLSREPKDSILLERCETSGIDVTVTHSLTSSSCAVVVNNVATLPTKELSSETGLGTAKIVQPINQSKTTACSTSQPVKNDAPSPTDTLSPANVIPVTNCSQEIDSEEINSALPSYGSGELQDKNETARNFSMMEVDRADRDAEGTDRMPVSCDTPNVDSKISSPLESTTNDSNGKTKSNAIYNSVKSTEEHGINKNSGADVQENSSSKDTAGEGSICVNDTPAGATLRNELQAAEEMKFDNDDKLKVTSSDSPSQGHRVDSRDSPRDKNNLRTPNSTRRKKSNKFNWQEKLEEKASKFADLYFERVKEALVDKPDLYCRFLRVIDEAGRTEINRVEVYWKLSDILADYPDLIELFIGFLEPSQAKDVGQFETWLELDKARNLLLNCESFYTKTKFCHELLKRKIELRESEGDSKKLIGSIRSLFRGNDKLAAEMSALFPSLSPPRSRSEDYEIIHYVPEKNGFDHVDEFEEMQLKPCDYSVEEPQQRRKTILDDFAAWLQRPASNNTEGRHESKKAEALNSGRCDKHLGICQELPKDGRKDDFAAWLQRPASNNTEGRCESKKAEALNSGRCDKHLGICQELPKDGRTALDFSSALDIGGDTVVSQSTNSGITSGDKLMVKSDSCKYRPDLDNMEDSTEINTNLYDSETKELVRFYPNIVSMNDTLTPVESFNKEERTSISGPIGPAKEYHEGGSVSPVFDPPFGENLTKTPITSQANSELSCSDNLNLPDSLMIGKSQSSGNFIPDLLPSFHSDLFASNDSFMSPVRMQDTISIHEQTNPANSSLQTPVSAKRDSQKVFQNESPLGTKLTTFRIDSKSSSKASGFQRIELTGDRTNSLPILPSNIADSVEDGSVARNQQHGKNLITANSRETRDEDANARKTDGVSAGDVLCDERGQIICKWSRDDDRLILMTCQRDGTSEATFGNIAEQLNGRTMEQVQQRFTKLMELLSMTGTS